MLADGEPLEYLCDVVRLTEAPNLARQPVHLLGPRLFPEGRHELCIKPRLRSVPDESDERAITGRGAVECCHTSKLRLAY